MAALGECFRAIAIDSRRWANFVAPMLLTAPRDVTVDTNAGASVRLHETRDAFARQNCSENRCIWLAMVSSVSPETEHTPAKVLTVSRESPTAPVGGGIAAGPLFIIRHGASVIRFLDEHSERILFVSVDPASCLRPIEFPAGLPQYFGTMPPPRRADRREEGSGWGSGAAGEGPPPTGFVLDLSDDWVRVGLTVGAEELKARVDGLIAEQTRQWPTTMGWLRERTRGWLQRTCLQAKSSGGVEFAVLMNSTKSREPTLTLVNYWLALPRTADGPLVHVRDFLEETADDDDEIAVIETRARRLLRSVRVRPAARRGGAAPEQEMLLVDYWIEVPGDPASAARVVFTRPGADSRDEVVAQCDAIVRSARWDAPGAGPP